MKIILPTSDMLKNYTRFDHLLNYNIKEIIEDSVLLKLQSSAINHLIADELIDDYVMRKSNIYSNSYDIWKSYYFENIDLTVYIELAIWTIVNEIFTVLNLLIKNIPHEILDKNISWQDNNLIISIKKNEYK